MAMLASILGGLVGRTVYNRTGLESTWTYDVRWSPSPQASAGGGAAASAPPVAELPPADETNSLFTALQEQLGLKLVSGRGDIDVVVVE
jgi:uncharacterized protein (TIGR03435 family)